MVYIDMFQDHSNSFCGKKTTAPFQLFLCVCTVHNHCERHFATHACTFCPRQNTLLPHSINFYLKNHHHTFFMWLEKKRKKQKITSASIKTEAKMKSVAKFLHKTLFWCLSHSFPFKSFYLSFSVPYMGEELSLISIFEPSKSPNKNTNKREEDENHDWKNIEQ